MLCLTWYWLALGVLACGALGAAVALVAWFIVTQRAAGTGGWH